MITIIFRFCLYIICTLSLCWTLLVFGGPVIIKKIASKYTGGALEFSDVRVSPTLGISITRVNFNSQNTGLGIPISGFSRSSELVWSLRSNQPFLVLDIGPTVLTEIGTIKNVEIFTQSYRDINWKDIFVVSNISGLDLRSFGKVDALGLEGYFNQELKKFTKINFSGTMFSQNILNSRASSDSITGRFSEIFLDIPIGEQSFSGDFAMGGVLGSDPGFSAKDAIGKFDFSEVGNAISLDLNNVEFPTLGSTAKKINIQGHFDTDKILQNISIDSVDGVLGKNAPSFSRISAEIQNANNDNFDAVISGNLREFELNNRDLFIGILPPSNFNLNLKINLEKQMLNGISEIALDETKALDMNASGKIRLGLEQFGNLSECEISQCKLSDLIFEYQINLDDEWVKGRSGCKGEICSFGLIQNIIKTSHTANIFAALNRVGILSPLSSLYLYSALTAGQKVDEGHQLKF